MGFDITIKEKNNFKTITQEELQEKLEKLFPKGTVEYTKKINLFQISFKRMDIDMHLVNFYKDHNTYDTDAIGYEELLKLIYVYYMIGLEPTSSVRFDIENIKAGVIDDFKEAGHQVDEKTFSKAVEKFMSIII